LADKLPLRFEFTTAAPMREERSVAGRQFYSTSARAATSGAADPVEIESPEAGRGRGWFRSGRLGAGWEYRASHVSAGDAEVLIRTCAAAYLAERDD
jgi:hypothetical protein